MRALFPAMMWDNTTRMLFSAKLNHNCQME
jgi:hypothetical protein